MNPLTRKLALPALAMVLAALVAAPTASADQTLCSPGSGPGQCSDPRGVAVDFETERVYVVDSGNKQVDVFEADGAFVTSLEAGFTSPTRIAVDNAPASPSRHDLYLIDGQQVKRISPAGALEKTWGSQGSGPGQFESIRGIGVDGTGTVHVMDTTNEGACPLPGASFNTKFRKRLQRFGEDGNLIETVEPGDTPCGQVSAFALDSAGGFYLASEGVTQALRKYTPAGTLVYEVEKNVGISALGTDQNDAPYAVQGSASFRAVTRFNGTNGAPLRRFGYGAIVANQVPGLAALAGPPSAAFLGEEHGQAKRLDEPPAGPVIAPPSVLAAPPVGNSSATLKAEINPEGAASTYRFQYLDQQGYEEQGESFAGSNTRETAVTALPGAADFLLHLASAEIGCADPLSEAGHPGETEAEAGNCLTPETTYRFRVLAENADGQGNSAVEGASFETAAPLAIEATYASEVGADSARLSAQVNPLGIPASGHFEYVDQATYEQSGFAAATKVPDPGAQPPQAELDFGAGEAPVTRSVSLALDPGTTYRYRVVLTNPLLGEARIGPERTLTTFSPQPPEPCPANESFRTGPSALLPDCRAYELVTPLDKEGTDVLALKEPSILIPATLNQSSVLGERLVYGTSRPFGVSVSAPYTSQYLASRDPVAGWRSHSILGPRTKANLIAGEMLDTELKLLSPDLCQAWVWTVSEPLLAPGAVPGFTNLYRRADQECGAQSWTPLTTLQPPHKGASLELQGTSADGQAAIYAMLDNLPGTEAPDLGGAGRALYFQEGATLPRYVCFMPNGLPASGGCNAGINNGDGGGHGYRSSYENAISADGSRVFWTDQTQGQGKIYVRLNPGRPQSAVSGGQCTQPTRACTIAVSQKAEQLSGTTSSRYWTAAGDGSAVIFTSGSDSGADLYRFEVDTATTTKIAGQSAGVMGASEDGSRIYFASEEVLAPANAQGKAPVPGKPNLYLYEAGDYRFIATLVPSDLGSRFAAIQTQARWRSSRVSPDGLHATFMSSGQPTGYDNTDALNGEADAEVYLYDASAGRLICASCNPTGARPVAADIEYADSTPYWAAAQLPVWTNNLYASRVLSADGSRLYFESADTLSPRDTNGALDVYQWEAPGTGGCDQADPEYFPANEGCLRLISSGKSARDSEFVDASPTGEDVFFATLSGLVPEDYGLLDIYDARVGGGLPPPPPPAPECEGEACQPAPQAPADPTPSSAAFRGAGNIAAGGAARKRCARGKRKVRRAGKVRCVNRQRGRAARSKRRAAR